MALYEIIGREGVPVADDFHHISIGNLVSPLIVNRTTGLLYTLKADRTVIAIASTIVGITGTLAEFNAALTGADFATGGGTVTGASSGTNTGDQTSIVGITGSLAEFNAALTGADFATGGGTASGTNTGDQTSVSGNAGTATALQTARNINGVAFDGTANITVTADATTLTNGSGTYTPTLFNTTNVTASTAYSCKWSRVGNVVTVSGLVDIDPTAAAGAATILGISIPVASSFTDTADLSGVSGTSNSTQTGILRPHADDRAELCFAAASGANEQHRFMFQYIVQ